MYDYIVCTVVRMENPYLREFVKHYLSLGFSKIIIYDNGYNDEESPKDILTDHIGNDAVEIIDFRDKRNCQGDAYNDCISKHPGDWILFIDADEFLNITSYSTIKEYIDIVLPNDCNIVQFNWKCYGDNELIKYEDKSLKERFKVPFEKKFKDRAGRVWNAFVKTMMKVSEDTRFNNFVMHVPEELGIKPVCCNSNGERCKPCIERKEVLFGKAYIDHYVTKTIEEWVTRKARRKYSNESISLLFFYDPIDSFFRYPNKITDEKIKIAESILEEIKNNGSN